MDGQYIEKLKTGGEIIISNKDWFIKYYFPGKDIRLNGLFVKIPGKQIDSYISAWRNNFDKYIEMKKIMLQGENYQINGEMGMKIHFGAIEGVCLRSCHLPVKTQEQLTCLLEDYENAKIIAYKMRMILASFSEIDRVLDEKNTIIKDKDIKIKESCKNEICNVYTESTEVQNYFNKLKLDYINMNLYINGLIDEPDIINERLAGSSHIQNKAYISIKANIPIKSTFYPKEIDRTKPSDNFKDIKQYYSNIFRSNMSVKELIYLYVKNTSVENLYNKVRLTYLRMYMFNKKITENKLGIEQMEQYINEYLADKKQNRYEHYVDLLNCLRNKLANDMHNKSIS